MAVFLWTASVRGEYFRAGSVNGTYVLYAVVLDFLNKPIDTNYIVPMGLHTPRSTRGVFYLKTDGRKPYSVGMDGIN